MQWDVSVSQAVLLTLLIGVSVGFLTTLVALALSLATFWIRIAGWRLAIAIVSSFLLVPLYVQATAWSAGFGSNGWLRLSQVDASKNPGLGVASVVWIHACAALPYCFWIVTLGLQRVHDASVDQGLIEFGPWVTLRKQIIPRLRLWLVGSMLWGFASVQYDMAVTNLFQTPTLCESVYQQVQFGKLRGGPIGIAWFVSLVCGLAIALGVFGSGNFQGLRTASRRAASMDISMATPQLRSGYRGWIGLVTWTVVAVCCLIPWLNLISRMGIRASMVEGKPLRSWSLAECFASLGHVADFQVEIGWSLQVSLWAVALSLLVCSLLIGLMGRSSMSVWILGLLGCMLATPGPLINLAIGHTLNRWMPSSLSFLSDRTLLGPILALQFRVLPIVFGLLWITRQRYLGRYGELLKLEEPMPWSKRCSVWIGYSKWSWLIAFWIGFSIAFGDLASYLLIQPPGVTTVAMRMFDLLHYGTKNREAGLAVALAIFGSVSSLAWLSAVPIRR